MMSLGKSTYIVDFGPISVVCGCASDTGKAGKKPLCIAIDRINRRFHIDGTMAYSDLEAEEILHRSQIGSVHPLPETVMPGTGHVGGGETSLQRLLCILDR